MLSASVSNSTAKSLLSKDETSTVNIAASTLLSRNSNDVADLNQDNCMDKLAVTDWEILFESSEEMYRRGCFSRAFPPEDPSRIDEFKHLFPFPRYNNMILW
jgi:hypothetical protein